MYVMPHFAGKGHYVLEASESFKDLLRSTPKSLLYLSTRNKKHCLLVTSSKRSCSLFFYFFPSWGFVCSKRQLRSALSYKVWTSVKPEKGMHPPKILLMGTSFIELSTSWALPDARKIEPNCDCIWTDGEWIYFLLVNVFVNVSYGSCHVHLYTHFISACLTHFVPMWRRRHLHSSKF